MQQLPLRETKNYWFFLLINTKSGGGWGSFYIQLKKQQYKFQYKGQHINASLHDLLDQKSKQKGLEKAVNLQKDQRNDVRIVICGGDGTILWGIEQSLKAGINFNKVVFVSCPIGTGNDFSRTIGWGHSPLVFSDDDVTPLKKRLIEWIQATVSYYDIWEVKVQTYLGGDIAYAQNRKQIWTGDNVMTKGMSNYMGIGIDARISYAFEMNRTKCHCVNMCTYVCCGLCYLFKGITQMKQAISSFYHGSLSKQIDVDDVIIQKSLILNDDNTTEQNEFDKIKLKKGYHGLVSINSLSYMAGVKQIWQQKGIANHKGQTKFVPQKFDDGLVEFLAFKNQASLGILNKGDRVIQGSGPFQINFKKQQKQENTFLQIDGQAYKISKIKQITLQKHSKIPDGRIPVMVRKIPLK